MRFVLTRDVLEFAARSERLTASRLECNVLATLLLAIRDGSSTGPAPTFAYGIDDGGEVAFAALRTPPWPLLASPLEVGAGPAQAAADTLIALWLDRDPDVSGVTSVAPTARAIADAWERLTGGTVRRRFHEAMHVLEEVRDPPRPARGVLRLPAPDERALLVDWMAGFVYETGVVGAGRAAAMVDARLRRNGLLVWSDERPVSMVGVAPQVSGVVRVGPVYTPPEYRHRGYAGTAVAAVSRQALARGAERCMLYTDIGNATSNKIYAEVGYRRVADWDEIALER